jgi:hypothetical protein
MLNLKRKPDQIFKQILDDAFESTCNFRSDMDDEEYYRYCYPNASEIFTSDETLEMIDKLYDFNKSPGVYSLNDYHLILLYDLLSLYCETQNDIAVEYGDPIINDTKISKLDIESLIEEYLPEREICNCCLFDGEKPSIEELEHRFLSENEYLFSDSKNDTQLFNSESTIYPDPQCYKAINVDMAGGKP